MRKMTLLVAVLVVVAMPISAHAGGVVPPARFGSSVQGPFFWHPFFFPGPFTYGYPGGLNYAYPGPYVSYDDRVPYTYGYPGPYSYGTWTYARPYCYAKPNGFWVCS